ncbi:MAG: ABC-type transport auxiliary lipoprotein family protein [Parvibaculaceae bacterium]
MVRALMQWKRLAGCAVLALGLQACALATVGSQAAPDIYVLTTPEIDFGTERPRLSTQLVVDEPYAPAALNSNRIVYQPSEHEIRYFADARWSDRAPQMLQVLLVDALDRSGQFQAVGRKSVGMRSDYLLRLSILTFAAEKSGEATEQVRILINAQLVRRFSDTIEASRRFEALAKPGSSKMIDIVNAFDAGTSAVFNDLSVWLYDEVVKATLAEAG